MRFRNALPVRVVVPSGGPLHLRGFAMTALAATQVVRARTRFNAKTPCAGAALVTAMLLTACGGGGGDATGPGNGGGEQATHPAATSFTKFALQGGPNSVAVGASGKTFVSLYYGKGLTRFPIDAPSLTPPTTDLTQAAWYVVVNRAETVAYVAVDGGIRIVDLASGAVTSSVSLQYTPWRLTLSPDESRLYAVGSNGHVWMIPTSGGVPVVTTLPAEMGGVRVSPSGGSVYVSSWQSKVWRLDPATLAIQSSSVIGGQGASDLVVTANGSELYVLFDSGDLFRVNAATLERTAYLPVAAGSARMAVTPDSAQLYLSSYFGTLTVVSRTSFTVVTSRDLGGTPHGIAFDKLGKTALISNENDWIDVVK